MNDIELFIIIINILFIISVFINIHYYFKINEIKHRNNFLLNKIF